MHTDGWMFMGWMWIFWIAIIIAIIYFVVRLSGGWVPGQKQSGESPEDVLKKRYARGEISKEQYEQMLQDLRK